jgi:hypothetical protein
MRRERIHRNEGERPAIKSGAEGGGGRSLVAALPEPARAALQPAFGHVINQVRLHDSAASDVAARNAHARAYTVGSDIHLRAGQFAPDTPAGLHLIAHELTHVSQKAGETSADMHGVRPPRSERNDPFERSARAVADAVVTGAPLPSLSPAGAGAVPAVQCDDEPNWMGALFDIAGGSHDSTAGKGASGLWDVATDDFLGGVLDFADSAKYFRGLGGTGGLPGALGSMAEAGGGLGQKIMGGMGTAGQWLSPLSIVQGSYDLTSSIFGEESSLENTMQGVLGAGNIFSGATSLGGLMGALPSVAGTASLSSIGAAGAGSMLAAGGQVASAGLAGYAAGRGLDEGTGWLMRNTGAGGLLDRGIDAFLGATGAGELMDSVGGGDAAAGSRGDYTISDIGARAMTGMDQLVTAGMRGAGLYDETKPAYTQTLGWKLAEVLPSWMQ